MSERTKRIEALFHAASELSSPEERDGYLNEACGGDADLRREVVALLQAAATGNELFQGCEHCGPRPGDGSISLVTERAGTVIGRYKLLEKIGEGGMGIVYMAEQEKPVHRKVALKIIKLGMDTRQVVARFEAERQALAMMNHPHIARVLDAGATETGRPYFVMELVQGVPITEFCDANGLSTEERLKLFVPVCQAIQSAHQKGIIHRDLKPSNVLVTTHNGAPHPMVIDFGVAKAIEQKLTEKTLFTNFATMIGTPAYMSPEQAQMSRLDVDTRADIYSLGVLLYELLTGTTPFPEERLRSVAYGEMQRIIAEEEPERPSTRLKKKGMVPSPRPSPPVGQRVSQRRVRGTSDIDPDLDWIVMKCLEKDRNRRYETATGLAADVQAHLNNQPIVARPPSAAYRFQKFVRRNKLQFAAATFGLVVLLLAVAVSTWQAVRATRAERSALAQARNAQAIKDFLIRQLGAENPYVNPQAEPGRRAFVERLAGDVETEFADRPEIEAELRMALSAAFVGLGERVRAAVQCEKALRIRQQILGPQHSDTLWALCFMAQSYDTTGRHREALGLMTNALAKIHKSASEMSSGEAEVLWTCYYLLARDRPFAEVFPGLQQALAAAKRTLPAKDYKLQNKQMILAYLATTAGRWDDAEALFAEGIAQCERLHGADSVLMTGFKKYQAYYFMQRGQWPEAQTNLEQILPILHRVFGTNHTHALDVESLLADVYEHNGRLAEATTLNKSLYPRWAQHVPYPPARGHGSGIAGFFVKHRQFEEAKAVYEGLRASWETHPPESAEDLEDFIVATAATKGWPAAAETCRKRFGEFPADVARWHNWSSVLLYAGDAAGFQALAAKALALPVASTNLDEQRRIAEIAALGPISLSADQLKRCDALLQPLQDGLAAASTNQYVLQRTIAMLQLRLGRFEESLARTDSAIGTIPPGGSRTRLLLLKAINWSRLDRVADARAAFDDAERRLKARLLDTLPEREGFLSHDERTDLILRREAQALLGLR